MLKTSQATSVVSNTFTVNPSKANTLKTHLAIEMSQNNALAHGKLQRCHTQRSNRQITGEIMQTYSQCWYVRGIINGITECNFVVLH